MEITYYGGGAVKINGKGVNVVMDPVGEPHGSMPKIAADIVTVSHDHPAHNNMKAVSGDPVVIDGPGEYEIKGIPVSGISSFHDAQKGRSKGKNTIYTLDVEGVKICHLGDLGENLGDKQLEEIGDVDVLLTPIDKSSALDAETAEKIVSEIEPKIVIPIHAEKNSDELGKFIKEVGAGEPKHETKLRLSTKDLPAEEMHLIILEPAAS